MGFATYLSGRVKTATGSDLDSDRSSYLDLKNAEPNLGNPGTNDEVVLSKADGTRFFATLGNLLSYDGNNGSINVDSAQVVGIIQGEGIDSDLVQDLVDSAYVQARQSYDASTLAGELPSFYLNWNNFSNIPDFVDSADVSAIILNDVDSAYVSARAFDQTLNTTDSAVFAGLTLGSAGNQYVFPTVDGTAGYALITDGNGQLTFSFIDVGVDSASILDILSNGSVDTLNFTNSSSILSWDSAAAKLDFTSGIQVNGDIAVTGTVDGRDVATDGAKLDGIEANAKDDQTITAGAGLTGGGTGDVTLNVGEGFAISVDSNSVSVVEAAINHNSLLNFDSDKHLAHSSISITAGAGLVGGGTIAANRSIAVGAGTGITVDSDSISVDPSTINHDDLLGFVLFEHVDHSGVLINAGAGLTGGGSITSSRTLNVGAGTGITVDSDTVSVNEAAVNHDNLAGYVANEHINHSSISITAGAGLTGGGDLTAPRTLDIGAGTGISVSVNAVSTNDSQIVHDNLSGFVADEHIAHSNVSIIAGAGLTGGGDISASRTLNIGAGTAITVDSDSISVNEGAINHDNLSGFVSNEHINHSSVSIIAGDGLSGGGDLTASRTLNIGAGTGITVDSDGISTNDSQIVHDNLSGFVANEHINHSGVNIIAGAGLTGGGDITASRTLNIGAGTGITVAADSISVNESAINHDNLSGFVANEHIDHSTVTFTAGAGLTGGGDLTANRTFNIGAGTGITVDSDTVSVNESQINHDNLNGFVANEHINHSNVVLTAGAGLTGGGDLTASRTFNIGAGTAIVVDSDTVSVNEGALNHDNLLGFVGNEHIDHSTVSITAGAGLTGGGDLTTTRTLNIGAGTGITVAADSISVNESTINHDNLLNFVADEHVAHSGVTMTAGAGLTGGGTIAASRTFNVGAGTGVTVTADAVSIGQDVATTANVTFNQLTTTSDVVIGGNLQVTGTTTTVDTQSLQVSDNMIYMNAGESDGSPTQSIDVGWAANVNDGGSYTHVGMFRDATDDRFKVFGAYTPEPDAALEINTGHASFALADFQAATFYGALSGNATTASSLATARTISLTGDVSGSTSFDGSANVSITAVVADNSHNHTTGNITGFTEAVQDIIGADVIGGSGITVTYNDTTGDTTIAHTDTSTQASVDNSNGTVIQDISLDGFGHITGIGSVNLDSRYYTETEADSRFVNVTGDTMTGTLDFNGTGRLITITGDGSLDGADASIYLGNAPASYGFDITYEGTGTGNENAFVITSTNAGTPKELLRANQDGIVNLPQTGAKVAGNTIFHDGYHPNADKWTTARTLSLTGDVTGSVSIDGSANASITTTIAASPVLTINGDASGSATFTNLGNATLTLTIADDSHNHVISNVDGLQTALDAKADETITITAGAGLTGGGNLTANRTISHADTSTQASVSNTGNNVIQSLTLDTYGHITAISSLDLDTEFDSRYVSVTGDTMTGSLAINANDASITLNDTSGSPTDQGIRIRAESLDTNLPGSEGLGIIFEESPTNGSPDTTPAVITTGEFYAQSDQKVFHDNYHPNADKWTTARTLTLTGAVTGSASIDGSGNVSLSTAATSDPTLTINGDASGSATFTNLGNATLTLTIADDSHNHVISNVDGLQAALDAKLNASAYTANDVLTKIKTVDGAGSGLDADLLDGQQGSYYLDYNNLTNVPNAASVNDNTITIAPGTNMTGGGSFTVNQNFNETITINHADTSSQASVNNSNGTVIQDITLDGNGHVTGIGSVNLDSRYYTETEADSRFVNVTGDTMTGNLTMSNANIVMDEYVVNSQTATVASTSATQIAAFTASTYGSAEVLITAKTGTERHISKLLIVHDGTTASATEYGKIATAGDLATYEVDISGGNVRILATGATATSTVYKVALTLMDA